MTPEEVVRALVANDIGAIQAAATPGFRERISAGEMARVLAEARASHGGLQSAGEPLVVYDLPLEFERGTAHLQIAYEGTAIAGLVIKPGRPTGRFGE